MDLHGFLPGFIAQITSPTCPYSGRGEETAERLLLSAQNGKQNVGIILLNP